MNINKSFLLLLTLFVCPTLAQVPDTDIFLCSLKFDNGKFTFSPPENITNRVGYDNQPSFSPDGTTILYVSVVDSNQSDIYSYDIKSKKRNRLTSTRESEYSPVYTPDGKYISVVRVDADSGQRFYKYPSGDLLHPILVKHTDSIGYSCWLSDSTLAMFILGNANTLQVLNLNTGQRTLIASDIGRCFKLSPDKKKMYFVLKSNANESYIYTLDCKTFAMERIAPTIPGNEDYAVLPNGELLMGNEGKLYILNATQEWKIIADFTRVMNSFYRLALSTDGTRLALVTYTGKKP